MKRSYLAACIAALISVNTFALEVSEPKVPMAEKIVITSPDDFVLTLGKVNIFIDLAAEHDTLFELQLRRAELKLEDRRKSSAFGYSKSGGIVLIAGEPVTHISVTGVENGRVSAIFYNKDHEIIAPPKKSMRVFNLDLNPLEFDYAPAQPPSKDFKLDVAVLLDRSGSMYLQMNMVQSATQTFLKELPSFTMCSVFTFGNIVEALTQSQMPCSSATTLLNNPIMPEGMTALASALDRGMNSRTTHAQGTPNLVIVVTDGISTEPMDKQKLLAIKNATNSKVLVFWAGFHDPEHLKGLADLEIKSSAEIKKDLDAFFTSIGVSVSGMQTLTLL